MNLVRGRRLHPLAELLQPALAGGGTNVLRSRNVCLCEQNVGAHLHHERLFFTRSLESFHQVFRVNQPRGGNCGCLGGCLSQRENGENKGGLCGMHCDCHGSVHWAIRVTRVLVRIHRMPCRRFVILSKTRNLSMFVGSEDLHRSFASRRMTRLVDHNPPASSRNRSAAASGVMSRCGVPSISNPTMNLRIVAERKRGG